MDNVVAVPARATHEPSPTVLAVPVGIANAKASVNDIPDSELLGRAVRNCRARQAGKAPRWVAISDNFALGSTYSAQLCRRFGVDPSEMVGKRR